jgi:hypothetical protein
MKGKPIQVFYETEEMQRIDRAVAVERAVYGCGVLSRAAFVRRAIKAYVELMESHKLPQGQARWWQPRKRVTQGALAREAILAKALVEQPEEGGK